MPDDRFKAEAQGQPDAAAQAAPAEKSNGRRQDGFSRTQTMPGGPLPGAEASGPHPAASTLLPEEEADYEALFLKDAQQRAHDAELAALASLALIRSNRGERNQMLFSLERELNISPRMVDRHLREIDREAAAALLSDSEDHHK